MVGPGHYTRRKSMRDNWETGTGGFMNAKLSFAVVFILTVLCVNPSRNTNSNQINKIVFNNYYKYRTTATHSDINSIDTTYRTLTLLSDSVDSISNEVITFQDSGINNVQSKHIQNANGIFIMESVAGNIPILSRQNM
jgi:hypothetical protein